MRRVLKWALIAAVALFLVLQLLPLNRSNPPVTREISWDSPETRALAQRACFDCHSNETVWPTYSRIAPASILLWRHVTEGRQHLNFSEWDKPQPSVDSIRRQVDSGEMPTWDYLLMHPAGRLTDAEKQQLLSGLAATYQNDPPTIRTHRE